MISAGQKGPGGNDGIVGAEFVFPPGVKSQFSGAEPARVREVVKALRDGGVPSRGVKNAELALAWGSALLMPNIVTLESVDWSISSLASCRTASLAASAVPITGETIKPSIADIRVLPGLAPSADIYILPYT